MRWNVFPARDWLTRRRWYFNLQAGNGEIIVASESYQNKGDALRTIGRIKDEAGDAIVKVRES